MVTLCILSLCVDSFIVHLKQPNLIFRGQYALTDYTEIKSVCISYGMLSLCDCVLLQPIQIHVHTIRIFINNDQLTPADRLMFPNTDNYVTKWGKKK